MLWEGMRPKYRQVKAPSDWPGKIYRWGSRIMEHHLVWWRSTGQLVPEGYVIHHKNGDGKDNRIGNLELVLRGTHTASHHRKHASENITLTCRFCGKIFARNTRVVAAKRTAGQLDFFCSKSHAAKWQHRSKQGNEFTHGTKNGYGYHRCRCKKCLRAHNAYMKAYRSGIAGRFA
jgi:hypothetical protein